MLQGDVDPRLNPHYPWANRAIALAYREQVFVAFPNTPYRHREADRYEYAVVFHTMVTSQIEQAERFVRGEGSDAERAALLRSAPVLMPAYRRAEAEFQREYLELGVGKDLGLARLSTLVRRLDATAPLRQRLFADVPPAHWAAKAVGDLRALGLLYGYPDGKFGR